MRVTFDNMIYRSLAIDYSNTIQEGKEIINLIKEKEAKNEITALQCTFVLKEQFKHLIKETTNKGYENCKRAIILSAHHCSKYKEISKALRDNMYLGTLYCPDSKLGLLLWVANFVGANMFETSSRVNSIIQYDKRLIEMAYILSHCEDPEKFLEQIRPNILKIKSDFETMEEINFNNISEMYKYNTFIDDSGKKEWKLKIGENETLDKVKKDYLELLTYLPYMMSATFLTWPEISELFPDLFKRSEDPEKFNKYSLPDGIQQKFVNDFEPLIEFYLDFQYKAIHQPENLVNKDTSKKSKGRWNDFFDAIIILSALASDTVLITNENDIISAYERAKMRHKVMTLEEYFKFIGADIQKIPRP